METSRGSNMNIIDRDNIRKLVMDMDEETELAYMEEIIKKRVERLERKKARSIPSSVNKFLSPTQQKNYTT